MSALDRCGWGATAAAGALGAMNLDRSIGLAIRGSGSGVGIACLGGSEEGLSGSRSDKGHTEVSIRTQQRGEKAQRISGNYGIYT